MFNPFKRKKAKQKFNAFSGNTPIYYGRGRPPTSAKESTPADKSRAQLREEAHRLRFNPYVLKYLSISEAVILGSRGFQLNMNVTNADGSEDLDASSLIQESFKNWGKKKVSSCGRYNLRGLISMIIKMQRMDGELFLERLVIDGELRYQLHASDEIKDDYHNDARRIANGIQYDNFNRPIRFYLADGGVLDAKNTRHIYKSNDPKEYRGTTSLAPAIDSLLDISKFSKATIRQHTLAATLTYFYEQKDQGVENSDLPNYLNEFGTDKDSGQYETDVNGERVMFAPKNATIKALPSGKVITGGQFLTDALREICSGLLVPYHALSSDLTKANFSSLKFNSLFEKPHWVATQKIFMDVFADIVADVLDHQLLTREIALPLAKADKYKKGITVEGYQLPSLDISQKAITNEKNLKMGLSSRTKILAEENLTVEDLLIDIQKENEMYVKYGFSLVPLPEPEAESKEAKA